MIDGYVADVKRYRLGNTARVAGAILLVCNVVGCVLGALRQTFASLAVMGVGFALFLALMVLVPLVSGTRGQSVSAPESRPSSTFFLIAVVCALAAFMGAAYYIGFK